MLVGSATTPGDAIPGRSEGVTSTAGQRDSNAPSRRAAPSGQRQPAAPAGTETTAGSDQAPDSLHGSRGGSVPAADAETATSTAVRRDGRQAGNRGQSAVRGASGQRPPTSPATTK